MPDLSVIIPAYNEKDNLPLVIRECFEQLDAIDGSHEVLVLDDGSTDGTDGVLKNLAENYPGLVLLSHEENRGVGKSLSDLIGAAKGEYVIFLPADLQVMPDQVPVLLSAAGGHALVMGWRKNRKDPFGRRILGLVYNKIMNAVLGIKLHDIDGVFILRKNVVENINMESSGAVFSIEMIREIICQGYNISEVEVEHHSRKYGRQTGASLKTVCVAVSEFFRLLFRSKRSGDV
ncbi:MAG: glycosyltransferase family 2 protein [Chloroflexi bacterium]|nr:glycosyltransferase family 2 protein [Chloroflexota bacterium]